MNAFGKVLAIVALVALGFGVACEKKEEAAPADAPAAEAPKTEAAEPAPAAEGDKPAAAAEGDKPAAEGDEPAAEGDKPADGDAPKAAPSSQ